MPDLLNDPGTRHYSSKYVEYLASPDVRAKALTSLCSATTLPSLRLFKIDVALNSRRLGNVVAERSEVALATPGVRAKALTSLCSATTLPSLRLFK